MFLEMDKVEGLWSTEKSQFGERFCQKAQCFLTSALPYPPTVPTVSLSITLAFLEP
jgi:hypothetical protein